MDSAQFSSAYLAAHDFLFNRINFENWRRFPYPLDEFKLDRMRDLLRLVGDPQTGLPIIHVAGTKGKGSTVEFLCAVLSAAGYRTGKYTSPHLETVRERFVVDDQVCGEDQFVSLIDDIRPVVQVMDRGSNGEKGPTFFELTTALALLHFAQLDVDVVVLEVGMGGRLDSTNVCDPLVSVITSISLDHTQQLGNSLESIAREKAGIIKDGVPVVSGVSSGPAAHTIEQTAFAKRAPILTYSRDFGGAYQSAMKSTPVPETLDYWEAHGKSRESWTGLTLGMPGSHQAQNAAVAIATLNLLRRQHGWNITESAIRQGVRQARCAARVECISRFPRVIVDTAHNVASIFALIETLRGDPVAGCRTIIFSATHGKDVAGMLEPLLDYANRVILTDFQSNQRGYGVKFLSDLAARIQSARPDMTVQIEVESDPQQAWEMVRSTLAAEDLVCVTGSFFLAAELRGTMIESLRPVVGTSQEG